MSMKKNKEMGVRRVVAAGGEVGGGVSFICLTVESMCK